MPTHPNVPSLPYTRNKPYSLYKTDQVLISADVLSTKKDFMLSRIRGRVDATNATQDVYLQILTGSSTVPPDGPVSHLIAPIKFQHTTGVDTDFDIDFTPNQLDTPIEEGVVICLSTTEFTKTEVLVATLSVNVTFIEFT